MIQVTANVFVETGFRGCNQGFVTTQEGIVMIDTPMSPTEATKWRDEIRKRGEVRYLVNTDQHVDHFMGNHFYPGTIVSHEEARKALLQKPVGELVEWVKRNDPAGFPLMQDYRLRIPPLTFSEQLTIYLGKHTFELLHLPGHVEGLTGVYIPEERAVFASDCIFYQKKSYLHEALPYRWLESLQKLKDLSQFSWPFSLQR